jgi:hypothetical protein
MNRSIPLLLCAAACLPSPAAAPPCGGKTRTISASEAIGTGFSADDVLAYTAAHYEADGANWTDERLPIVVDVQYDGGRILACEGEPLATTPTATTGSPGIASIDRLDIEVTLTLQTDDGQLDETAPVFVSATSVDGAWTRFDIAPADLGGTLVLEPGATHVFVDAHWTPGHSGGVVWQEPMGTQVIAWPF